MRISLSVVAVALMLGLTGCSTSARHEGGLAILLEHDVTQSQRSAIEQKLHETPHTRDVSFETTQQAYEKFTQEFKDNPAVVAQVDPESLPESFHVTVTDVAFAEAIETVFATLPGVAQTTFTESLTAKQPGVGFIVQVRPDVTDDERTAIEQAIHSIPQVEKINFEPSADAYTRLRKNCKDEPVLAAALDPAAVFASYRFTSTELASFGSEPAMRLSRLGGVEAVLIMSTSAL